MHMRVAFGVRTLCVRVAHAASGPGLEPENQHSTHMHAGTPHHLGTGNGAVHLHPATRHSPLTCWAHAVFATRINHHHSSGSGSSIECEYYGSSRSCSSCECVYVCVCVYVSIHAVWRFVCALHHLWYTRQHLLCLWRIEHACMSMHMHSRVCVCVCCAVLSRTSNLILHISSAFILYISNISSCAVAHTHTPIWIDVCIHHACACSPCVVCVCVKIAVSRAAARSISAYLLLAHMHYTRTHDAKCKINFSRTGIRIEWRAYLAVQVQHSRASQLSLLLLLLLQQRSDAFAYGCNRHIYQKHANITLQHISRAFRKPRHRQV